ncbi:hypothetical protein HW555_003093 [Spodoptera exigua]|uniref:Uncharacterized protein n=1 Tax=Spodoptera exigua TaxID=7107 RepID=A0A835GM04_SPOEX|nr:hypothetical protein HW555_003093 [Spodoptera exigua]
MQTDNVSMIEFDSESLVMKVMCHKIFKSNKIDTPYSERLTSSNVTHSIVFVRVDTRASIVTARVVSVRRDRCETDINEKNVEHPDYTEEEWRLLNNIYDDVFPTSQLEEDKSNESLANDSHNVILGSEEDLPIDTTPNVTDDPANIPSLSSLISISDSEFSNSPNPSSSRKRKPTYKTDLGRKRKRHIKDWVDVRRKTLTNCGLQYVSKKGKIVPAKSMKPPCPLTCKLKCTKDFTDSMRKHIFDQFWQLSDHTKQWEFINKFTKRFDKKRMTTENPSRRKFTTKYYLPLPTDDSTFKTQQVCLKMFCGTLAITDQIIRTAHSKLDSCGITSSDNRGKHLNHPKKIDDEMIRSVCDHVKSFQPVESHYTRKNTSKLYLDNSLSFNKMFSMYKDWPELSKYNKTAETERQYRTIVNDHMNIAFFIPKKDLCDKCHAFSNEVSPTEEQVLAHNKHILNKETARKYKAKDKEEAIQMSQDMLYDLKELLQNRNFKKNTSNHDVKWNNIKEVCVKRSEPDIILYKYDLEGDYFRLNTLVQTRRNKKTVVDYCNDALKPLYSDTLPIPEAKHKDLIQLCEAGHIPRQYHAFFKNLKKVQSENVSGSDEDD